MAWDREEVALAAVLSCVRRTLPALSSASTWQRVSPNQPWHHPADGKPLYLLRRGDLQLRHSGHRRVAKRIVAQLKVGRRFQEQIANILVVNLPTMTAVEKR